MKLTTRDYSGQKDYAHYDTARLREEYVVEDVFGVDDIHLTYSYIDRIVFGGVIPVKETVVLGSAPELRAEHFLDRRELGVINIGEEGTVEVDGTVYVLKHWEAIYVGRGAKEVRFASKDGEHPAMFYMASCPAHKAYPTTFIPYEKAIHRRAGEARLSNERTINQYIHADVLETCQLAMGLTHLEEGSVWNTMPCHTHARRMEVYFYFDIEKNQCVFHLMGPADETRHVVLHNNEAVISPSWSIHSGCGTKNYTFIWAMCGENQAYDDMDVLSCDELK
ncbi:MAG: 5-dehydro-4-deoxy-D-glucuronate isomerase [Candidatus Enteromonas sp.]